MSEHTFRITSPDDLLALVPCVLGFHPRDSLVLVVVSGSGGNLHARIDLTDDDDEVTDKGIAQLVHAVRRNGGSSVVLIAYTDDAVLADEVVDRLDLALFERDVDVVGAVRADGSRWFNLLCEDDCCPPEGHPYDLSSHPITAQSVLEGLVTLDSREALADTLVGSDTADREAVAGAADEARRRLRAASRHPLGPSSPDRARRHLVTEGSWVRDRVRRYLTSREPLDAEEAGRLAVALVEIPVRDVAWSEMDRTNARVHVDLWRDLVRRVPSDLVAAPAGLLAFAAWLSGDGALAWCAIDRCQRSEPGYRLATLVGEALSGAVPPSTWTPLPPEDLPLFAG